MYDLNFKTLIFLHLLFLTFFECSNIYTPEFIKYNDPGFLHELKSCLLPVSDITTDNNYTESKQETETYGEITVNDCVNTCGMVIFDTFFNEHFKGLQTTAQEEKEKEWIFFKWFYNGLGNIKFDPLNKCYQNNIQSPCLKEKLCFLGSKFEHFESLFNKLFLIKSYAHELIEDDFFDENYLALYLLFQFDGIIFNKRCKIHGLVPEVLASINFFQEKKDFILKLNRNALKNAILILKFLDSVLIMFEKLQNKVYFFSEVSFILRFLFEELCYVMSFFVNYKTKNSCLFFLQVEIEKSRSGNKICYALFRCNVLFFLKYTGKYKSKPSNKTDFRSIGDLKKYVGFYFDIFNIVTGKKYIFSLKSEKSESFEIEFNNRKIIFSLDDRKNMFKLQFLPSILKKCRNFIVDPQKNATFPQELTSLIFERSKPV